MTQSTQDTNLSRQQYEQLCSDLAVELVQVMARRSDYLRLGVALEALMRVHRSLAAQLQQSTRTDLSMAMAAYAGELMSPADPRTNHPIH